MTVRDLIIELLKHDLDAEVYKEVQTYETKPSDLESVYQVNTIYANESWANAGVKSGNKQLVVL